MSGPSTAHALAEHIAADLQELADPARAAHDRRYLRTDPSVEHLGVSVPATRQVVRGVLRPQPALDRATVLTVVSALWQRSVYDCRLAAVEVLNARVGALEPEDVGRLPRLLREAATWALVDPLAIGVAGPLLGRHPDAEAVLDTWVEDDDLWVRRAALLAHLRGLRAGAGEWERFAHLADGLVDEQELFIRKAIGWVLRDTARRRPELVVDWLRPRLERVSGVTLREALRPLTAEQRAAVLDPADPVSSSHGDWATDAPEPGGGIGA